MRLMQVFGLEMCYVGSVRRMQALGFVSFSSLLTSLLNYLVLACGFVYLFSVFSSLSELSFLYLCYIFSAVYPPVYA